MIEEFAEPAGLRQSACLFAVDVVHGLVDEETEGETVVEPWGARGAEVGAVDEEEENVEEDEEEADEGDGVGG